MSSLQVPADVFVLFWLIGIAYGYFLARMRIKRKYVLIAKDKLKRNQAQPAHVLHTESQRTETGRTPS